MSKKAATGAGYLLYDVKSGSGAFTKTPEEARELADLIARLSRSLGMEASALITNMDQPLRVADGHALEICESVSFLRGGLSSADLCSLTRTLVTHLLQLKGIPEPEGAVDEAISSGAAYEKLKQLVAAQGDDAQTMENPPISEKVREAVAPCTGYVARLEASSAGRAALLLGAGRKTKEDEIDPSAGVEVFVKAGDEVEEGNQWRGCTGIETRGKPRSWS